MNIVKIPNPKNESEEFSFAFNGVYDQQTTQEELFTAEGATTRWDSLKHLFRNADYFCQSCHTLKLSSKASMSRYSHTELREQAKRTPCAEG